MSTDFLPGAKVLDKPKATKRGHPRQRPSLWLNQAPQKINAPTRWELSLLTSEATGNNPLWCSGRTQIYCLWRSGTSSGGPSRGGWGLWLCLTTSLDIDLWADKNFILDSTSPVLIRCCRSSSICISLWPNWQGPANWAQAQSSFFTFNPLDFCSLLRSQRQIDA